MHTQHTKKEYSVSLKLSELPDDIMSNIAIFFPDYRPLSMLMFTCKAFASFVLDTKTQSILELMPRNYKKNIENIKFEGYVEKLKLNNFSPDDKQIVIPDGYKSVKVYDIESNQLIRELIYPTINDVVKNHWVTKAEFSDDGNQILAQHLSGIFVWNTSPGELLYSFEPEGTNKTTCYSKRGEYIVYLSGHRFGINEDPTIIYLLNSSTGSIISTFEHFEAFYATISPNNKYIMSVSDKENFNVIIWETITGKKLHKIAKPYSNLGKENCACFSPNSNLAAIANRELVDVLNIGTGEIIHQISNDISPFFRKDINGIYFSPNGDFIANRSGDKQVSIFDLVSKTLLSIECGMEYSRVTNIDFFRAGNHIMIVPGAGSIKILSLNTLKTIFELEIDSGTASFSRQGNIVYFDKENGQINILKFDRHVFSFSKQQQNFKNRKTKKTGQVTLIDHDELTGNDKTKNNNSIENKEYSLLGNFSYSTLFFADRKPETSTTFNETTPLIEEQPAILDNSYSNARLFKKANGSPSSSDKEFSYKLCPIKCRVL